MLTTVKEFQAAALLLCAGVLLGLLYDLLRVFRLGLSAKAALSTVLDAIFWAVAFSILFYFSYLSTAGDFRVLSLLLVACGALIYFAGISKFILRLISPFKSLVRIIKRTKAFKYLFK